MVSELNMVSQAKIFDIMLSEQLFKKLRQSGNEPNNVYHAIQTCIDMKSCYRIKRTREGMKNHNVGDKLMGKG